MLEGKPALAQDEEDRSDDMGLQGHAPPFLTHTSCGKRKTTSIEGTGCRNPYPTPLPEGRGHVKLCPLRRRSRGEREGNTTLSRTGSYEGNCHTGPCGGSLDSLNCGKVKSSAMSWNTTCTRLPMATFASASGWNWSSTRLAIRRMPS
jgi:hypothetical protein